MRRETRVILIILALIGGAIYAFSQWHQYHLGKRKKVYVKQQKVACLRIAELAGANQIPWTEQRCNSYLVGMRHQGWKPIRQCLLAPHDLRLLHCVGEALCEQDHPAGCTLAYLSLLRQSNAKRGAEGLFSQCSRGRREACIWLADWMQRGTNVALQFTLNDVWVGGCRAGERSMCTRARVNAVLERCVAGGSVRCRPSP